MLAFDCRFDYFVFIWLWQKRDSIPFHLAWGLEVSSLGCRAERGGGWIGCDAYQGACDVDAAIAHARVIQPLWLGEAEESVV